MSAHIELKKQVFDYCMHQVNNKLSDLNGMLKEIQDSANAETKSSMGDKYETGRSMAQLEKNKVLMQREECLKQKAVLDQLHPENPSQKGELGSLLVTDAAIFFISISLGKVIVSSQEVFVISPVSPIGKSLLGISVGDEIAFMKSTYRVKEVC